jgi:4-amino-4-deoxy-L-arabinose transferase-like glycosyltransferase
LSTTPSRAPVAPGRWPLRLDSAAWVLGALALWLLATAGLRPLLLPDEGRYAEVAREMLAHDGLVPLLNGLPFFHKPPLTYWVDQLGMALFGISPFTARLGPALGAWLMGAALWAALRRRLGARAAGIGLLVLATNPFFFVGAQYANHDMLVAGTITLAVLAFARALEDGAPLLRWLLAGWAACALAVLAKGLIGVVLPALVIGPWLLAQGRWRDLLRLLHPLGLGLFLALALPWMLLMQHRYPAFFDYFIVEQHFRRFAATGFNNAQPWWFLPVVLPLLTLPWSLALPAALRRLWAARGDTTGERRWLALLAWWVVVVVGFFSLPTSKLVGYILPALVPWSLLLAAPLASGRGWRPLAAVGALACLGIVITLAWLAPKSSRDVGLALRTRAAPTDLVVMIDNGFNDVQFEARLPQPPLVASRWDDPEIPQRDNWRKELADTARFDPAAAARQLYPIDRLPALVCRGQPVWFVTDADNVARVQAVPGAVRVMLGRHAQLWRAEPRPCPAGA